MKSRVMTHRVFLQVFVLSTLWLTALTTSAASTSGTTYYVDVNHPQVADSSDHSSNVTTEHSIEAGFAEDSGTDSDTGVFWSEDFEGQIDPVEFDRTNGEYTVNFKGLTNEKSFSGNQSFKLDVTVHSGSYIHWTIPLKIPAEGNLKFSGRILVEEAPGKSYGILGFGFYYWPCWMTVERNLRLYPWYSENKEEWKLVELDIADQAQIQAEGLFPRLLWAIEYKDVGSYMDGIKISLLVRDSQEKRIVIYVDDLKIEGQALDLAEYQQDAEARWAPVAQKHAQKIASWEDILNQTEQELASFSNLPPEAEKIKNEIEGKIPEIKKYIDEFKKYYGFIHLNRYNIIESFLSQVGNYIYNIKVLSQGTDPKKPLIYNARPIINPNQWILPDSLLIPGRISNQLNLTASPGEYEPASFVINPRSDINGLEFEVSDFEGNTGSISSSAVDVKVVKVWYQGGSAGYQHELSNDKILVPELLLNDDTLVKVDYDNQENYLKLSFPDREEYFWIGGTEIPASITVPNPGWIVPSATTISMDKFPVKDSPTLLPVDIPAYTNKQFWVTVHVPENAKGGFYTGTIKLLSGGSSLETINLSLKVLPIKLLDPYYTFSVIYGGTINPEGQGFISAYVKNEEQFRKEQENLVAHGITNTDVYVARDLENEALLHQILEIRDELGMGGDQILYFRASGGSFVGAPTEPTDLEALKTKVKRVIEIAKSHGINEVYFYGLDERKGEELTAQRPAWEAVREVGGKIYVAGYKGSNFPLMGDIQDLLICAGPPSKEEADKWHSLGHKIWNYANPQPGIENPEIYRRNFGLLLWQKDYDGATGWIYHSSIGNPWNDFDSDDYRDFNFTYPTVDGVIDTIQWEGYREGADDVRYLTTLEEAIKQAKQSGDESKITIATEAEQYLANLDIDRDLDTIRSEMIDYILELQAPTNQYTITPTAGTNGSISPSGAQIVTHGDNITFTITPNPGYSIADVQVDGSSVGAVSSYTFSNVTADHTIVASFVLTPTPVPPIRTRNPIYLPFVIRWATAVYD